MLVPREGGWPRASLPTVLVLLAVAPFAAPQPPVVARFGIVTDIHYADADAVGTRVYRDSLPKLRQASRDIRAAAADFVIELGDFKDTDASQGCDKQASPHCVNITVGFLRQIEGVLAEGFDGPRFHVLGNHDVDILNQSTVLANEANSLVDPAPGPGYYSWSFPPTATPSGPDSHGCLATMDGTEDVWVIHPADGTRNWVAYPTPDCPSGAVRVPNISVYGKRHNGQGQYGLNKTQCEYACAKDVAGGGNCSNLSPPVPAPQPLRFIVLNGDFTDQDEPWSELDVPFPGEAWNKANIPTLQMEWLAQELQAAVAAGQRVIVFVHYRLDGGPNGPVGKGLGPTMPVGNKAWIDDCTLENAAVVRAVLEEHPGLVLATFSGHDHAPKPAWTQEGPGKPVYWTHAAMVEGHFPSSNAYSVVSVRQDCSIDVAGYGNATSALLPGPPNCSLTR